MRLFVAGDHPSYPRDILAQSVQVGAGLLLTEGSEGLPLLAATATATGVVTLTGNQTIAGIKTFTDPLIAVSSISIGPVGGIDEATLRVGGNIRASGVIFASDFILIGGEGGGGGTNIPLDALDDVDISSPSDGQVLTYQSGIWINAAAAGGGSVSSVFGRTGAVISVSTDYEAFYAPLSHTQGANTITAGTFPGDAYTFAGSLSVTNPIAVGPAALLTDAVRYANPATLANLSRAGVFVGGGTANDWGEIAIFGRENAANRGAGIQLGTVSDTGVPTLHAQIGSWKTAAEFPYVFFEVFNASGVMNGVFSLGVDSSGPYAVLPGTTYQQGALLVGASPPAGTESLRVGTGGIRTTGVIYASDFILTGGSGGGGVTGLELWMLEDVDLSPQPPTAGQILQYNNGKWRNVAPVGGGASALNDLTDVSTIGTLTGHALMREAGGWSSRYVAFTDLTGTLSDAQHGNRLGGLLHAVAAPDTAGFMSGEDKTKLNGIATGAQVNTVTSVFTRTGAVVAASTDYQSFYPSLTGANASGTWGIAITGNAGTATALATGRAFSLTGEVTAPAITFNGTGAVALAATVTNAAVIGKVLTGFTSNSAAIVAADTVLAAFGKAQGQINDRALATTTLTLTGTASQITVTGGAQSLAANRTWTLSLPASVAITTDLSVGNVSGIAAATLRVGGNIQSSGVVYANDFILLGGAGGGGTNIPLNALDDVDISSPSDGQVLTYQSGIWINAAAAGGTVSAANVTAGTFPGTYTVAGNLSVNGALNASDFFGSNINLGSVLRMTGAGTYTRLHDGSGVVAMYLGGAGDTANYYDNSVHYWRTRGGGTASMMLSDRLIIGATTDPGSATAGGIRATGISEFTQVHTSDNLWLGGTAGAANTASSGVFFGGAGVAHANIAWFPNERTFRLHTGNGPNATSDAYGAVSLTLNGSLSLGGQFYAYANYTSHTLDGLFAANARPCTIAGPNSATRLRLGYLDEGGGQYWGRIGFLGSTNWSLGTGTGGNDFSIGTGYNGAALRIDNTNRAHFTVMPMVNGVEIGGGGSFAEISGTLSDTQHGSRSGGSLHAVVTTGTAGFMAAADKSKLDGIAAGAQVNTVSSVFTRTGAVVAASTDYQSFYPSLTGANASGTWGISITGNSGTVTNGVYTTGSYSNPAWITALAASKITAGTFSGSFAVTGGLTVGSLTSTGDVIISKATPSMQFNRTDTGYAGFYWMQSDTQYWFLAMDNNTGGNLSLHRYNNSGSYLGTPLSINRTTGIATFSGAVYATDFILSSDARLKTHVTPIQGALDKLCRIGGYTYTGARTGQREAGVMAQELAEVLPEAVSVDGDGYLSVAYDRVIPLLVAAIKELRSEARSRWHST
jgi:hypothetical protein